MRRLILLCVMLIASVPSFAQLTLVTATVKDLNGALYSNGTVSINFVGQNTTPDAGPYLVSGSVFQTSINASIDANGLLAVSLYDNVNAISPTPSQWQFNVCSAKGYPGGNAAGQFCFTTLITITGATQSITTQLSASAPLLPILNGGCLNAVCASLSANNTFTSGLNRFTFSSPTYANPNFITPIEGSMNGAVAATMFHIVEGGNTGAAEGISGSIIANGSPGSGYQYQAVGGHTDCRSVGINCMGGYFENWIHNGATIGWGVNPVVFVYPDAGSGLTTRNEGTYTNYGPLESSDVHYGWDVTGPFWAGFPIVYGFHASKPNPFPSAIATISRNGSNLATVTMTANGIADQPFSNGNTVVVAGVSDNSFNCPAGCIVSGASSSSFNYTSTGSAGSSSGGTVVPVTPQITSLVYGEPGCCTIAYSVPASLASGNSVASAVNQWHYFDSGGNPQVTSLQVSSTGLFQFSGGSVQVNSGSGGFIADTYSGIANGITLNALGSNQSITATPTGTGSFKIQLGGLKFGSGLTEFIGTGTTANTDVAGVISISSSTTGTYTLQGTYTNPPYCQITPAADPTAVGVYWVTATNTVVTAHIKSSGTIAINYLCAMTN
jgi:hypothetical protein